MARAIVASSIDRTERIDVRRLGWVGPLAIVAAVGATVLFTLIASGLAGVSPDYPALTPAAVAEVTAVCVLLAVGVFALVARYARRPVRLYWQIALATLILSFIPDLAMPYLDSPSITGAREVVILMLNHVVAAAVCVPILTGLARVPPAD
jgi:hypothetical protein